VGTIRPVEPIASALAQPKKGFCAFQIEDQIAEVGFHAFFSLFQTRSIRQVATWSTCTATAASVQ
jgi:hypothetical protein